MSCSRFMTIFHASKNGGTNFVTNLKGQLKIPTISISAQNEAISQMNTQNKNRATVGAGRPVR